MIHLGWLPATSEGKQHKAIGKASMIQALCTLAVAFAEQCMAATKSNLPAATLRGEQASIRQSTRNKKAAEAANVYLAAFDELGKLALCDFKADG